MVAGIRPERRSSCPFHPDEGASLAVSPEPASPLRGSGAGGGPATKSPAWTKKWGSTFRVHPSLLQRAMLDFTAQSASATRPIRPIQGSNFAARSPVEVEGRMRRPATETELEALLAAEKARQSARGERPGACQLPRARLASRAGPDSAAGRRLRLLRRARVFSHSNALTLAPGQSPSRANHRPPARTSLARLPRYRLRAGSATLLRLGGCDRPRRDRDLLGAGEAALSHRRAPTRAPAPRHSDHRSASAALARSASAGGSSGGGLA
jgi:hypothetical protein